MKKVKKKKRENFGMNALRRAYVKVFLCHWTCQTVVPFIIPHIRLHAIGFLFLCFVSVHTVKLKSVLLLSPRIIKALFTFAFNIFWLGGIFYVELSLCLTHNFYWFRNWRHTTKFLLIFRKGIYSRCRCIRISISSCWAVEKWYY